MQFYEHSNTLDHPGNVKKHNLNWLTVSGKRWVDCRKRKEVEGTKTKLKAKDFFWRVDLNSQRSYPMGINRDRFFPQL